MAVIVLLLIAAVLVFRWATSAARDSNTVTSLEAVAQSTTVNTDSLGTTQTTRLVDIDPDDYIGVVPPGVELETYPRVVPWELDAVTGDGPVTVLMVNALSHTCSLSKDSAEEVTETFDRVEVQETDDTVTIQTWLGAPEGEGFWPGCEGTGWGFPVEVELDSPLGDRELVDPACDIDRYAHWLVCERSKLIRPG